MTRVWYHGWLEINEERMKFDDVGNDVRQMEASAENHRKVRVAQAPAAGCIVYVSGQAA